MSAKSAILRFGLLPLVVSILSFYAGSGVWGARVKRLAESTDINDGAGRSTDVERHLREAEQVFREAAAAHQREADNLRAKLGDAERQASEAEERAKEAEKGRSKLQTQLDKTEQMLAECRQACKVMTVHIPDASHEPARIIEVPAQQDKDEPQLNEQPLTPQTIEHAASVLEQGVACTTVPTTTAALTSCIQQLEGGDNKGRAGAAEQLVLAARDRKLMSAAAVQALRTALQNDTDANVRSYAAWALGETLQAQPQLADAASVEALRTALLKDTSATAANVCSWAAWALGQAFQAQPQLADAASVEALRTALQKHTDANVRTNAAFALGRAFLAQPQLADAASVEALRTALQKDTNDNVRSYAAWALRLAFGAQPQLADAASVEVLRKALQKDADANVRNDAAQGLWRAFEAQPQLADAASVEALRTALQKDTDDNVRAHAAGALSRAFEAQPQLADSASVEDLRSRLKAVRDPAERTSVAWALGIAIATRPELSGSAVTQDLMVQLGRTGRLDLRTSVLEGLRRVVADRPQLARGLLLKVLVESASRGFEDITSGCRSMLRTVFVDNMGSLNPETLASFVTLLQVNLESSDNSFKRFATNLAADLLARSKVQASSNLSASFTTFLGKAWKGTSDPTITVFLASAARSLGKEAATLVPQLRGLLRDGKALAEAKRSAILALQNLRDCSGETRNVSAMQLYDEDADLKVAAANSLWACQDAAEPQASHLAAVLRRVDNSIEVRAAAARALGVAGVGAVKELAVLKEALLNDNSWEVLLEVIRCLVRFGEEMDADSGKDVALRLRDIMMNRMKGENRPVLRVAATVAIGALGEHADVVLKDLEETLLSSELLEIRKAAEASLRLLSGGTEPALKIWEDLVQSWGQATATFEAAVKGDASGISDRLVFEKRTYKTEANYYGTSCSACWPVAGRGLEENNNVSAEVFSLIINSTPEDAVASCAAVCARATPFVIDNATKTTKDTARFRAMFAQPDDPSWQTALRLDARRLAGYCVAFTVLNPTESPVRCLLFQTMPTQSTVASQSGTPIYAIRTPSASSFCAKAWEHRTQTKTELVNQCKQKLVDSTLDAGSSSPGPTLSASTVGAICEEECEGLVDRIQEVDAMPEYMTERRDFELANKSLAGLKSTSTREVALADACTRDVVQLVEHHHIKCCATACGWSYTSRTCEGIHLFSDENLTRWRDECCMSLGIIRGSDRDRMCRSADKQAPTDLLAARGDSEAAELGQEVSAELKTDASAAGGTPSLLEVQGRSQQVPPLSEEGYQAVVGSGTDAMKDFIRRVVASMNGVVTNLGELDKVAAAYSIKRENQSYIKLTEQLGNASLTENGWVRVQAAAAPCKLECSEQAFFPATLLQCSGSSRREWFSTKVKDTCRFTKGEAQVTKSPHECGEVARKGNDAEVQAAAWQWDPTSFQRLGRPAGTCRFYVRCGQQWDTMLKNAKPGINSTTEVLWSRITLTGTT